MRQCIMAPIAVAFALGIVASVYIPFAMCAILAFVAMIIALAHVRPDQRTAVGVLVIIFVLGIARYSVTREVPNNDISRFVGQVTAFEGVVVSDPEVRSDRVRVVLRPERAKIGKRWITATGSVMTSQYLFANTSPPGLEYGDLVRISCSPYIPVEPTNPGQFSWKDYLARQNIYSCASIKRASDMRTLTGHRGNPVMRMALSAKRQLEWSINQTHPQEQAGLVTGMVLGTYSYLSPDTFRNFTRTGTLHLLAASGYNCYLLLFIASPILSLIKVMPKWRHLITVALIVLYLLMVGPKPSLMRAAIMSSLMLLALPLGRAGSVRNLFFTAMFLVLLIAPADLFDVGFQLSFLAVWALIWIAPILEEILHRAGITIDKQRKHPSPTTRACRAFVGLLTSAIVCTSAVTLLTAPVVAYYFNYFSLVSLPANMVLTLGVPLIFGDGLISPFSAHLGSVGQYIGYLGTQLTDAILATVNYFGELEWAVVSVKSPNAGIMAGYYLVLYSLLGYVRSGFASKQK